MIICSLSNKISQILCSMTEIKEKINISEGFMKHKKSSSKSTQTSKSNDINVNLIQKNEKFNNNSKIQNNLAKSNNGGKISTVSKTNFSTNPNNNHLNVKTMGPINRLAEKLQRDTIDAHSLFSIELDKSKGPIYATSWIKYFKYIQNNEKNLANSNKTQRSFISNVQFNEQLRLYPEHDKEEKSNDGVNDTFKYIPDDHSFYAILFKDSLNILTSRQVFNNFI